ncbi:MAG: hypothetical protein K6G33_04550 [Ruminococcus sp.]|uniref:DUF5696 domain-containing protein n=1 Tax=Ruminococcus sp. TaxID=41978 RepID=UPI0025F86FCD|nr:DUF5696 domain-containing protein [Ruminococcus sp.]MCR5599995.1 hypothetical protein [Ruminococcus sp.]
MRKSIKSFLLCLLAAASLSVGTDAYADDDTEELSAALADEADKDGEQEKAKRSEAVEKAELSAEEAEKFLKKIGSADGYDIYYKDKDIADSMWETVGGKPASKKDYTAEQQLVADETEKLKKLGELVAIDTKTGQAAASFKSGSKCDEGKLWVSDAGRYFVITDEAAEKVVRVRQVISTPDSKYAFMSADGRELELLKKDMKDTDEVLRYDGSEDGKCVYRSESGSFAWVTADKAHFLGAYRYGAENDSLRMIVDDRSAVFGIEDKKTGYIWWSSPIEASQDKTATGLIADELRSSNVLRYGVPLNRSGNNVLRSGVDTDCTFTVTDIKNGIRVVYDYTKAGFRYPVEYTLEGDHLRASVKVSEIKESKASNVATEMTVLGSFGAASDKEDGYFVIPDGCGALVRFNNNRSFQNNIYQQRIYGSDITAVPQMRGAVSEQIYLPVYGIVNGDNALLAVAAKGDSNAYITANVSKQSNSSYNICNFTFILRGTDNFLMSGSNERYTVFEKGEIKSDDIEVLYYPISKKGADYTDIAARYRQYLLEEQGVEIRSKAGDSAMYLDLYGGTMKKKPILGIPVSLKTSVTDYSQAADIISTLREDGVDDMVISYNNWTNDGIKNKVDTGAKPSGKLGGRSDFSKLTKLIDDSGYELYPVSDNRDFFSGNGYWSFTSTAVRVSGAYSQVVSYDKAYGIPDGYRKNMSLLSPSYFGKVSGEIADSYSKAGLSGVSLASLTSSLYGDYGKKNISRAKSEELLRKSYEKINSKLSGGILADSANAYALPYVSHITGVPMSSGRFDLFDEDIPFYQLVMHGVIPYSTTAVNGDADSERLLLMAAATGSCLSYDMIHSETSELKDTEYDVLYYANYKYWTDTAAKEYALLKPVLSAVSDSFISDYETDGSKITATYENGVVVKVDLEKKTIDCGGEHIRLSEEGGIRY